MAKVQEHLLDDDSSSSSSSLSSSDDEVVIKKGGKKDVGGPAGLCCMATIPKRRSRSSTSLSSGFCTMALDGEDAEREDPGSSDDTASEVSISDEEILAILEDNKRESSSVMPRSPRRPLRPMRECLSSLSLQMTRLQL